MPFAPATSDPEEQAPLMPKAVEAMGGAAKMSVIFAFAFLVFYNVAFIIAALASWATPCDVPLKGFMLSYGIVALVGILAMSAILFKFTQFEKHVIKVIAFFMCILLLISCSGLIAYKKAQTCQESAPTLYKWALGCLLTFFILLFLIISVPLIIVLAPIVGKILAFLLGLIAKLMDALTATAGGLTNFTGAKDKTFLSIVATYVNSCVAMWFFVFFLAELKPVYYRPCDQPLQFYVLVSAGIGLCAVLFSFYYSVLFDPPEDGGDGGGSKIIMFAVLVAVLLWGFTGIGWYRAAETCMDTAPRAYELAGLMTMVWYAILLLIILMLLMAGLDFLMAGKLRLVVVFEKERPMKTKE